MAIKNGPAKIQLRVTEPRMKSPKYPVLAAQHLLDHNRYGMNFHPGVHDGEYGPHSAAATHLAKFLLGYPKRLVNGWFGPNIYGYLAALDADHAIKRPRSYQIRGAIRTRIWKAQQAKLHSHRLRATSLALSQVGISESPPYSNRVKYTVWYGFTGPWCAMFVSWCFSMVGRHMHYASVAELYYDARYGRNGLTLTGSPEKGDIVALENLGHTGIFLEWTDSSHTYFRYVSGNTGGGSEADGGDVEVHTLHRSIVNGWIRVNG